MSTVKHKVLVLIGTRPEAIKMAPVIAALRARNDKFETRVCLSGQHKELLQPALDLFNIVPDDDFNIVNEGSGLNFIAQRVISGVDKVIEKFPANYVLVQGDTTTSMAASLAAFYRGVAVGHVEAGLRSGRLDAPWPEEANRRITSIVANLHFAPTEGARAILLREGVEDSSIFVTGNTVVDALLDVATRINEDQEFLAKLRNQTTYLDASKKLVLVTGHRRESFGEGFRRICEAIAHLAKRDDTQVVYPVHLNPMVRGPVHTLLGGLKNVSLVDPVSYEIFVYLMMQSSLILTDSGGVQEEAPSLGKRVLVMRDVTERNEGIAAGTTELVGTSLDRIVTRAKAILNSPDNSTVQKLRFRPNPFGDGKAAERIVSQLDTRSTNAGGRTEPT
ncbi:MAG: UDP-N-acetylglucosamine 2-epimerase (non-hydrolyzing) [Gammaproteobacteria bacterium]